MVGIYLFRNIFISIVQILKLAVIGWPEMIEVTNFILITEQFRWKSEGWLSKINIL